MDDKGPRIPDPQYKSMIERALIGRLYGLRPGERATTKHPGSKSHRKHMGNAKQRRRNRRMRATLALNARVVTANQYLTKDEM